MSTTLGQEKCITNLVTGVGLIFKQIPSPRGEHYRWETSERQEFREDSQTKNLAKFCNLVGGECAESMPLLPKQVIDDRDTFVV